MTVLSVADYSGSHTHRTTSSRLMKAQCLYTVGRERCQRPGEDVISGPGFRFCKKHEPIALEILRGGTVLSKGWTPPVDECATCREVKPLQYKNMCGKCYQQHRRNRRA